MHYQLFIPGKHSPIESAFEKAGLDSGFYQNSMPVEVCAKDSPAGVAGTLFFWKKKETDPSGYQREKQTWIPSLDEGKYWIGFWNDSPPTPEDLQRPVSYAGKYTLLDDGHNWLVPAARYCPHQYQFTSGDQVREVVNDQFRGFWERSGQFMEILMNVTEKNMPHVGQDWARHALEALQINYRITAEVVNFLSLFSNQNLVHCVAATFTQHQILEELAAQKKTESPPE